ncbi:MAG: glycosyltransferase [Patescibacteria group bacterium]
MTKKRQFDVSVVFVTYNGRDFFENCIASLREDIRSSKLMVEVIVVDNGSTDGMRELSGKEEYNWIKWILSDNVGFSGGNNRGMKVAQGKYILLLNADTLITKGTLRSLYSYLDNHASVGVVGPQLRFGDGSLQVSAYDSYPNLLTGFLENTLFDRLLYWLFPYTIYPGKLFSRRMHDREREVKHILGAAMFLRREVWEQTEGMDERFFMYREETDWQRRIGQAGWKIMFYPTVIITHFEGGSTGQTRFKKQWDKKLDYYLPSVYGFENKWHGWLSSWLLVIIYVFGSLWILIVLLPTFMINNLFGWMVPRWWQTINRSITDISIYHVAVLKWHVKRFLTGKSVFLDVRGKLITNYE